MNDQRELIIMNFVLFIFTIFRNARNKMDGVCMQIYKWLTHPGSSSKRSQLYEFSN